MVIQFVFRQNSQCVVDVQPIVKNCIFSGVLGDTKYSYDRRKEQKPEASLLQKDLYLLYDIRVIKRHLQGVAMSVVGINNICDGAAALICKGNCMFLSIQINSCQLNVFRDVAEVDREGALLKNRS